MHLKPDIVLKQEGQKGFPVFVKRWIIERTNAWVSRQHRFTRDQEHTMASSEAFLYAAMIRLDLRHSSQGIDQTVFLRYRITDF